MFQKYFACELLTLCSFEYVKLYKNFLHPLVIYNFYFQNFFLYLICIFKDLKEILFMDCFKNLFHVILWSFTIITFTL